MEETKPTTASFHEVNDLSEHLLSTDEIEPATDDKKRLSQDSVGGSSSEESLLNGPFYMSNLDIQKTLYHPRSTTPNYLARLLPGLWS